MQCVLTKRFDLEGMNVNTAAGTDDKALLDKIEPLIKKGYY